MNLEIIQLEESVKAELEFWNVHGLVHSLKEKLLLSKSQAQPLFQH